MTLSERRGTAVLPGGAGRIAGAAGARLRKWRDRVANGDATRFDRRLRWDGLDTESALRLLGPVRLQYDGALPGWARFLDAALSDPAGTEEPDRDVLDTDAPQPFETLLWRFLPEAARRMRASLGPCQARLAPAAVLDLQRGLLARICRTAARPLCAEFDAFRAAHSRRFVGDAPDVETLGRGIYRDFLHALDGEALAAWLLRYPMLARLLATCCRQWIASTTDLVRRLDHDAEAIRSTFGIRDRTLRIASVRPDLSDPHRDGRTVCLLRFESGTGLVYKPRPLALDRCFADLLSEISRTCGMSATKRLRILDRGGYGWVEVVEATPCPDRTAVERFHLRAGMLTCLVYALGGSDLHAGNLIAAGEYPVPIDLECIAGAPLDGTRPGNGAGRLPGDSPAGSVFRTGMPPTTRRAPDGVFQVVGGLADPDPGRTSRQPTAHTNTDWMAWQGGGSPDHVDRNLPVLNERPQPASAHLNRLLEGFRLMYEALGRDRSRLLASRSLRRLEREEFRVLIRDTRSYAALLESALVPQHLTSGPDWSIALDVITAPSLAASERPPCWATRIAERVELERLDIPLFAGSTAGRTLRCSEGMQLEQRLAHGGQSPGERLALLNSRDMRQQLDLLRMSFTIADAKRRHRSPRVHAARQPGPEPLRRQHVLVEVHAIVDLLRRLAVDDGQSLTWLALGGPPPYAPALEPVGIGLFSGTSGIALFLVAVAAVARCRNAHELAARIFDPLCRRLEDRARRLELASEIGIGGATGLGGLVYALTRAGSALRTPGYLAAAGAAAGAIDRTAIAKDEVLDVVSGASGALLGLLALHAATGDGTALRSAVRCGEHLLDHRVTDPATGLRSWPSSHSHLETGFAHGGSGIACALRRLAGATGKNEFRQAATEAWTLGQRRSGTGNTPQVAHRTEAPGSSAHWQRSWCRGAAGMGLARLGCLDDTDSEAHSDIEAALESVQGVETSDPDSLCCGRMGQAEFLFSAGLRLGRRSLCEAAATIGRRILTRALDEGRFAIGTDEGFRPGLFQGVAGIGYELLRLHAPDIVPSVLLWE